MENTRKSIRSGRHWYLLLGRYLRGGARGGRWEHQGCASDVRAALHSGALPRSSTTIILAHHTAGHREIVLVTHRRAPEHLDCAAQHEAKTLGIAPG